MISYSSIGEMNKDDYRIMIAELLQTHGQPGGETVEENEADAEGAMDRPEPRNQELVLLLK